MRDPWFTSVSDLVWHPSITSVLNHMWFPQLHQSHPSMTPLPYIRTEPCAIPPLLQYQFISVTFRITTKFTILDHVSLVSELNNVIPPLHQDRIMCMTSLPYIRIESCVIPNLHQHYIMCITSWPPLHQNWILCDPWHQYQFMCVLRLPYIRVESMCFLISALYHACNTPINVSSLISIADHVWHPSIISE